MTRRDREGPIHKSILQYLTRVLRDKMIHHSPAETRRPGRAGDVERSVNAAMGVSAGFPDLMVILGDGRLLFFEVKAPGNYPSPKQRAWGEFLTRAGHLWAVVYSIDDVRACLAAWGIETAEAA